MAPQDIPLCDAPHFTRLVNVLKLLTIDILVQEIHSVKSKFKLENCQLGIYRKNNFPYPQNSQILGIIA